MRRRLLTAGAALCAARAARAMMAGEPPDSPLRRVDPIGTKSPWSGVAAVTVDAEPGAWSGVVVAPRFVLTAGHVAAARAPASVRVHLHVERADSFVATARSIIAHPFYRGPAPGPAHVDLALIELERDVPAEVRVHPLDEVDRPVGQPLMLVGYGASGFGAIGVSVAADARVRRWGANVVDRIELGGIQARPWLYLFTFDSPGSPGAVASETGLAAGDSGSPAFVRTGGGWKLYGVNTFITQKPGARASVFGTVCGGQLVAPHVGWIRQAARASV